MKVDLYERIWMYAVVLMLAAFFTSTAIAAVRGGIHPPSHVETIDPRRAMADPRFQPQGVSVDAAGRVHARVIGLTFAWLPQTMTVPAGTPVTFHVTSTDVQHGFQIVGTNGQAQIMPGYISQFTTQFDPGEYLVAWQSRGIVSEARQRFRMRAAAEHVTLLRIVNLPLDELIDECGDLGRPSRRCQRAHFEPLRSRMQSRFAPKLRQPCERLGGLAALEGDLRFEHQPRHGVVRRVRIRSIEHRRRAGIVTRFERRSRADERCDR